MLHHPSENVTLSTYLGFLSETIKHCNFYLKCSGTKWQGTYCGKGMGISFTVQSNSSDKIWVIFPHLECI